MVFAATVSSFEEPVLCRAPQLPMPEFALSPDGAGAFDVPGAPPADPDLCPVEIGVDREQAERAKAISPKASPRRIIPTTARSLIPTPFGVLIPQRLDLQARAMRRCKSS